MQTAVIEHNPDGLDTYVVDGSEKVEKSLVYVFCIGNPNQVDDAKSQTETFVKEGTASKSGVYPKCFLAEDGVQPKYDGHQQISADLNSFHQWMEEDIEDYQKLRIHSVLINNSAKKEEILMSFRKSIREAILHDVLYFHFYHSGHSNKHGDILISEDHYGNQCAGFPSDQKKFVPTKLATEQDQNIENAKQLISIQDLLAIVQQEGYLEMLKMTLDSCFAGEWCFKAREIFLEDKLAFNLVVDASCTRENPSYIGRYTQVLRRQMNQVKYAETQGVAKFYGDTDGCYIVELKDRRLKSALAQLVMSSFGADGLICNDTEAIKQAIKDGKAKTVFAYY